MSNDFSKIDRRFMHKWTGLTDKDFEAADAAILNMERSRHLEALILHYYSMMKVSVDFTQEQLDEYQEHFGITNMRYGK